MKTVTKETLRRDFVKKNSTDLTPREVIQYRDRATTNFLLSSNLSEADLKALGIKTNSIHAMRNGMGCSKSSR